MIFRVTRAMILAGLAAGACRAGPPPKASQVPDERSAFAAASGVRQADSGTGGRAPRVIPLGPLHGDAEVVFGNPDSTGEPFVMRIQELPGTVVPPHSHPVDEHITVVQGTWYFGLGDTFDSSALQKMPVGTYAFAPKGSSMFAYSPDSAIVQVHGVGPFHIRWREGLRTLDDSNAARTFSFRRGDRVSTPRGEGTIRQGYASGKIIQYEIEAENGRVFMAHQRDTRQPDK